jgi:hypothetical protein
MMAPTLDEQIARRYWRQHLTDQKLFGGNLNTYLKDAAREAGKLVEDGLGDSTSALVRRAQYQESRSSLLHMTSDLWNKVDRRTLEGMEQASERAAALWHDVDARLAGHIDTRAAERQFMASADHAIENIRSRYVLNIDLAPSVYKNKQLTTGMIDRVVNNGILLNKSSREIASDVRYLIRPDVPGGVSYAAQRLGRTELNNAFHETTRRAAEEQPWVEGMKWHLSGSHPRPDECNRLADSDSYRMGEGVFPSERVPPKPHPQCLCFISAVTKTNKEFIDDLFSGKYDSFLAGGGSL